MSRPIKSRPIAGNKTHWLEGRQAIGKDAFPYAATVLRDMVMALVWRIHTIDPSLASELRVMIGEVALYEWMLDNKPFLFERKEVRNRIVGRVKTAIELLAIGRKSRRSHIESAIIMQWDLLADILEQEPFPLKRNNDAVVALWLKEMGPGLAQTLSIIPCGCNYQENLRGVVERPGGKDNYTASDCRTNAEVMLLLLAELHNTTPETIKKLRKPANIKPAFQA